MRKLTVLLVVAGIFTGCGSLNFGTKYLYDYILQEANDGDMKWRDDNFDFQFEVSEKRVNFILKNKSAENAKIIWDEASLVILGEAKKIAHMGVKYIDMANSQVPTVIPPGAMIQDAVIPVENVYYSGYSGWSEIELLPTYGIKTEEFRRDIIDTQRSVINLYLPISSNGKTKNYKFNFGITSLSEIRRENNR